MNLEFRQVGDGYLFKWPALGLAVSIDRLREDRDDLKCDLTITTGRPPFTPEQPGLLYDGNFNLRSPTTRSSLERRLQEKQSLDGEIDGIDWSGIMEQLCYKATRQWREGDPLVELRHVDYTERPRWLLEPYLEYGGPTDLFGDGGSCKSITALGIAISVVSGRMVIPGCVPTTRCPVAYLDWETDALIHAERMAAICAALEPPLLPSELDGLFYRLQAQSLSSSVAGLRRLVAKHQLGAVIIDSRGLAAGGRLEDSEATLGMFRALRELRIPGLVVDHVNKEGRKGGGDTPYGNIYAHISSRLTWGIVKQETAGEGRVVVALSNHKSNNGRLRGRLAYEIIFVNDDDGRLAMIGFQRALVADVPKLLGAIHLKEQLMAVLQAAAKPLSVDDIVLWLETEGIRVKPEVVGATLRRNRSRLFGSSPDGRLWSPLDLVHE